MKSEHQEFIETYVNKKKVSVDEATRVMELYKCEISSRVKKGEFISNFVNDIHFKEFRRKENWNTLIFGFFMAIVLTMLALLGKS